MALNFPEEDFIDIFGGNKNQGFDHGVKTREGTIEMTQRTISKNDLDTDVVNGDGLVVGQDGGVNTWLSVSFTIGTLYSNKEYILKEIRLFNVETAGSPGAVTVSVYLADGSKKPTGNALATAKSIAEADVPSQGWFSADFSNTELLLKKDTQYTIVIAADDADGGAGYTLYWSAINAVTGESMFDSTDDGATWGTERAGDLLAYEILGLQLA